VLQAVCSAAKRGVQIFCPFKPANIKRLLSTALARREKYGLEVEDGLKKDAAIAGGGGAEESSARQ
jgi:hypothetical protein